MASHSRRRSRSRSRSPRSSASSSSEMSKSRSTRSSRERARRRRRRRRRRSRSESSSSSDSSSSSSGSRESSRRRNTIPSASRLQPPRGMPIAPPHFGKHGNSMLGMGGGMGMMGMGMGMGGVPVGGMGPGGIGMVGGGGGGNVGGRKDYAAMASVAAPPPSARDPFTVRGPPMGGRGYALHSNVSLGSRPVASSSGGGKNYANFAHAGPIGSRVGVGGGGSSGGGSGGDRDRDRRSGGSYADQARDVRNAGRMLGAALSGGLPRSGGGGGRFDRGVNAPPSPPGRDQFGREREWRGNGPNVRRAPASASNGQPPVVHGSGFGTFSMASSISMGSNGGGPLQTAAATALRPQPSLTRDSRSPVGGAPMSSSALGSSSAPLTRADLVRQHSLRERRQRQMAHRASLSSSPPSALAAVAAAAASSSSSSSSSSTSSCPPEEGRYRGEKEERKGQDGEDKKRRSSSEHQDKDNGRIRTERCSPVDDRNRRDAQFRGHHQQQESKGGVDDKSKDRSRDAIASAGTSAAAGTNLGKRSALYDRSMSPCLADGNGSGRSGAPQPTVGDNSCAASTRHGKGNGDDGSGSNRNSAGAAGSGSRANTLGGVAPRLELPKGDDPGGGGGSNGKSPSRREAANHSGAANGGFPEAREGGHRAPGGHIRSDAIPHGHEHGNGQGLFAGGDALLPNEDDAPSCGEAGGSEDDGEIGRDERRREHERERGAGWKSDGFREGGGDFRRLSAGGGSGSGGEIPGVRGFIRERDRPDSPRDRGRYNPTPLQPPPMIAPDDQQGTGTLSAAARRASIAFHQIGRNDWQDKGVGKAGISGGGRPGEGHKRPRSPQLLGKGLHSACPRSSPSRHQDLRNQDSRGAGAYHPDANSNRSANHASNRHGREGRSSGPAELRHASEGTYHSRHQPPPLLPAAPDGPGSCPQHHQSRHGHRHNPNNSVGAGAATGPRSGRSSSHSAIQSERGVSRVGSNARTSPVPGHGKTSGRNSPLSRHGSPLQPGHGAGAQDSPVPGNSTEAGDVAAGGSSGGLGETNGWAPGRRLRGPVITDRLVSLKAEFLELHDMLLESDFQWEQSQKFCEVLKVQLDELMLAPHRNRDPYYPTPPQPPPIMGPDGPGTLSAAAKKPSLSYHPVGRGDLQDKGVVNAGASREMKPGEIHKNSRSAQLVSKGLQSDCSRSSPNRNQDLKNQGYRGAGVYHPDANSDRSASHASNRHGRKGRSSGPTELRHVSERIYHSRHQPPPLPPAAPDDPGSCLQHHQSRHGHCHYPNNSVGAGAATGPRSGRSSSHSAIHSERGASRSCFNARASSIPIACHENTPCRNSQFSRHESPLQSEHGAQGSSNPTYTSSAQTFCPYGAWSSPVRRHSADAGDGAASGSAVGEGEMNRWAQGGQLRETVITDRLVLLKAEFLELHDLLLESDFLWEQCQKFHDLLKVELDELMFAPLPKRYPLAQPLAR